jgi:hypothetical protein
MKTLASPLLALLAALLTASPGAAQSRAGPLAAAGATIGALGLGSFFGLLAAGLCDRAVCDGEFTHGFMIGAPAGAIGGALLGAGVGALISRPSSDEVARDGPLGTRGPWSWHVHYGRPTGRAAGPPPGSAIRAGVGYRVRQRVVLGAELVRLGFVETQRVFDPTVPISPFADEDARTTSLLLSWIYHVDPGDHVRVALSTGGARTRMTSTVTVPVPVRRVEAFEYVNHGVHLGAGLEAGWTVAGAARMGFEARLDWISATPMGDLPMYTLSLALRG